MKKLPLFPLPVVLFPGTVLPLQIFELRYRRMVKECLADNSPFVVLQTRDATSPDSDFYPLGTRAIISDWQPLANQMIGIQVQGQQRVRVTDIDQATDGLLQGYIEILADNSSINLEEQSAKLEMICAHLQQHSLLSFDASRINVDTAELFSFQLASLLPFSGADKQRLLEITSPLERLELMATLLKEF
ncbi:LON peptidase substrate-binding domain-containing protein [Amphritea sp.]|uniref:LON peptidase substrate-binding domain-containing protein n=1 Tax=Amphritea sp. TaxID=1872502 RepID=UPI003A94BDE2